MRRRARTCVVPIALVLAAAATTLSARPVSDSHAGSMPATLAWKAVAASGNVHARPVDAGQQSWRDVARGDELMPQTTVETGRTGRVTLTRNAGVLIVDPESRVELPDIRHVGIETSIVQTRGSVLYKVDKRTTPHFEVVTPYLVAGVKGTAFLVTVNDRYASVTVQSGRVEITDPGTGDRLLLGPGESVVRRHRDVEMDLVRDQRRDRDARKEFKRLDRMDTRASKPEISSRPDADSKNALSEVVDKHATVWVGDEDADKADALRDTEGDTISREVEDLTRELIEEMINEGMKDGSIRSPDDDIVQPN
jgi:hypothetical protein